MGLDAIVFRNARVLAETFDVEVIDVDPDTGEAQVDGADGSHLPPDAITVLKCRLGNLSEIVYVREAVRRLLGTADSTIEKRILYSASHSGDTLGPEEFPALKRELTILQSADDVQLGSFVAAISKLISAAETERNPIVFV